MHRLLFALAALTVTATLDGTLLPAQELSELESSYLSNVRQVTHGFVKAGEGYFSPDGQTIVYQAVVPEYPFYQIYTQPLADPQAKPRRISTGRGRTTCAYFSTDGKRILFASSHLDPELDATEAAERKQQEEDRRSGTRRRYSWPFDPHSEIFVADLDGNILQRLTNEYGYDAEGAYSRDGKRIAYCHVEETRTNGDAQQNPDIYVMNADGSDKRRVTSAPGYDGGPFISPDGQWIVYRTDRKKAEYLQIHVIGIDGRHDTALTDMNGVNWGPYWHPTRPYIIWSGADHSQPGRPNYDLWLVRYEVREGRFVSGQPTRITDSTAADVLPVFSPDGSRLMWTSTRTADRSSQLFIADFELPE